LLPSRAGTLTTLHSFNGDGGNPAGALVQASDGNFYGTASGWYVGGANVFKITPTGTLTVLHWFCSEPNCADGNNPFDGLVKGADGNYYATTLTGGAQQRWHGLPSEPCTGMFQLAAPMRLIAYSTSELCLLTRTSTLLRATHARAQQHHAVRFWNPRSGWRTAAKAVLTNLASAFRRGALCGERIKGCVSIP